MNEKQVMKKDQIEFLLSNPINTVVKELKYDDHLNIIIEKI